MFIAKKLRSQSVSAYLIYMYQVEDLIRAYGLDAERIAKEYLVQNTLDLLEDHHKELLADSDEHEYKSAYYKALPQIVALRTQGNNKDKHEMENCIDALYGATLLRMQGKELSASTQAALKPISELLKLIDNK